MRWDKSHTSIQIPDPVESVLKMVTSSLSEAKIRKVLGLGYWVQGFRCFPWMAVNFFLKDGLQVDPSTLQLLQNSANLPMIGKPLYGVISDAVYIAGQHRIPYLALGGTPTSFHFFFWISFQFLNYPAAQNFKFSYDWLHSNNTITWFALLCFIEYGVQPYWFGIYMSIDIQFQCPATSNENRLSSLLRGRIPEKKNWDLIRAISIRGQLSSRQP